MKKLSLFFFVCLVVNSFGQCSSCLDSLLAKTSNPQAAHQILFLKGADCINCYRAGKLALQTHVIHPDLLVVRDVPRRYTQEFLADNLGLDTTIPVIYDNTCWDCMDPYLTSMLLWTNEGKVLKKQELKYLLSGSANSSTPILRDSFDITRYVGGSSSNISAKGNYLLTYNEFTHKVYEIDPSSGKSVSTYTTSGKGYLTLDSLGPLFHDVAPWRIAYTKNLIRNKAFMLSDTAMLDGLYTCDNAIFISMSIIIVDTSMTASGKRTDTYYSYHLLTKYDYKWNLSKIIAFPARTLPNYDTFFNQTSESFLKNDSTFYMMVSSLKTDSLFAVFNLNKNKVDRPSSFMDVHYPSNFPHFNNMGHLQLYQTLFAEMPDHKPLYTFSLGNRIYTSDLSKSYTLSDIQANDLVKDSIHSFIHTITNDKKNLYVIYSNPRNTLHYSTYDLQSMQLINSTVVYTGQINQVFFWNNDICILRNTDEAATLYRYSRGDVH